jgi:hypothetical protein
MKTQILEFINQNTSSEKLYEQSTKQVAQRFSITTSKAYQILNELASEGLIEKYAPVNGDKFDCCGWIRIDDNQ